MEIPRWLRIVCFGGGSGQPVLLRGLRNYVLAELTAVVTTFDYGGRSKQIIDMHSLLPPGDIARCMLALSRHEELYGTPLTKSGKNEFTAMHILVSGGELLFGSRQRTFSEIYGILDIAEHHNVVPVTRDTNRHLCAKMESGRIARNEPDVDLLMQEGEVVESIYLDLPTKANTDVINAIDIADVIVTSPGSFYTSVLPNFLPDGTRDHNIKTHIIDSSAPIFFVMNLVTEGLGMNHLSAKDIVEFAEGYLGRKVDRIIINDSIPRDFDYLAFAKENKYPIEPSSILNDPRTIAKNLWTNPKEARHNSDKLAHVINNLAMLWYGDHTLPTRAI